MLQRAVARPRNISATVQAWAMHRQLPLYHGLFDYRDGTPAPCFLALGLTVLMPICSADPSGERSLLASEVRYVFSQRGFGAGRAK